MIQIKEIPEIDLIIAPKFEIPKYWNAYNEIKTNEKEDTYYEIGIALNRFRKNCTPETIAKKIGRLFSIEFICSLICLNNNNIPLCRQKKMCPRGFL